VTTSPKTEAEIAAEYTALIERVATEKLTPDEQLKYLCQIYDISILRLAKNTRLGQYKGSSAMLATLERTRLEMKDVQSANKSSSENKHSVSYELPLPTGEADPVEA